MRRRIDVRRVVHAGGDALRQHAGLGVVVNALDLDVLEVGPVRGLVTEAMGQVVELEPHAVVVVLLERDAADFLGHGTPPYTRIMVRLYCELVQHVMPPPRRDAPPMLAA